MTRTDWLASTDPGKMLAFLAGRASDRKLRLFACACCRRVWHLLRAEESRQAVETAERYADGAAGAEDLARAKAAAKQVTWASIQRVHAEWALPAVTDKARAAWVGVWVACAAEETTEANVWSDWGATGPEQGAAQSLALRTAQVASWAKTVAEEQGLWSAFTGQAAGDASAWQGPDEEEAYQSSLLRDLFGHLFDPCPVQSDWLGWRDGLVPRMAAAIHHERRFQDLPILADALEDAGCQDPAVLAHCRTPGPHTRGCWVIDALLERN
jgi:hypothetical protein